MAKDPICGMNVDPSKARFKAEKDGKTYYFCSEHCKHAFQSQGKGAGGHAAHHAHMVEDFKKRFWVSLIVTIPVLILSPMIQSFFRYSIGFFNISIFGLIKPLVIFTISFFIVSANSNIVIGTG